MPVHISLSGKAEECEATQRACPRKHYATLEQANAALALTGMMTLKDEREI